MTPSLDLAVARTWGHALAALIEAARAEAGCSAAALAAWERGWREPALRRLVGGARGWCTAPGMIASSFAFEGAARAEFDGEGGWQELPLDALKGGPLVVTLPVFADGIAVDLVAWEPAGGRWGALTGLHDGLLGSTETIAEDLRLRLRGSIGGWLRGGGPMRGAEGVVLLDDAGAAAEALLLTRPLICDDEAHADAVAALRDQVRRRVVARLRAGMGAPGALYLAERAA